MSHNPLKNVTYINVRAHQTQYKHADAQKPGKDTQNTQTHMHSMVERFGI